MAGDPSAALARALLARAGADAALFAIEAAGSEPWASVTFVGARHLLRIRIAGEGAGDAADRFLAGLEEAEFALPGHIVADIGCAARAEGGGGVTLEIAALTIEEA
ncbi:MAG: hypothetical protein ACFBQW_02070 [Sphingomonadaceae bacterium]